VTGVIAWTLALTRRRV